MQPETESCRIPAVAETKEVEQSRLSMKTRLLKTERADVNTFVVNLLNPVIRQYSQWRSRDKEPKSTNVKKHLLLIIVTFLPR
ncbi:hypothetical protein O9993_06925 [Vibrio lentus]|nr:hypothetical protein [Vibrio lentus]